MIKRSRPLFLRYSLALHFQLKTTKHEGQGIDPLNVTSIHGPVFAAIQQKRKQIRGLRQFIQLRYKKEISGPLKAGAPVSTVAILVGEYMTGSTAGGWVSKP